MLACDVCLVLLIGHGFALVYRLVLVHSIRFVLLAACRAVFHIALSRRRLVPSFRAAVLILPHRWVFLYLIANHIYSFYIELMFVLSSLSKQTQTTHLLTASLSPHCLLNGITNRFSSPRPTARKTRHERTARHYRLVMFACFACPRPYLVISSSRRFIFIVLLSCLVCLLIGASSRPSCRSPLRPSYRRLIPSIRIAAVHIAHSCRSIVPPCELTD